MLVDIEPLTIDLIEEITGLLESNNKETGQLDEPLDVDWDSLLLMGNMLIIFTLRKEDGVIKGILAFTISPCSFYRTFFMAQQMTFYIMKGFRGNGIEMIRKSEHFLKDSGIDVIFQSSKYGDRFGESLKKMGYIPSCNTFMKRI